MKKFKLCKNKYLDCDIVAYYNCDYLGYQKDGNPDFINHLKNMSNEHKEIDLVKDFIEVTERAETDIRQIICNSNFTDYTICVIPRSKSQNKYKQSQLMFKEAISCIADNLGCENGTNAIKRIKDTKTTHNWRLEHNTGKNPYKGITKDTCEINPALIKNKRIILVDDIYTEDVNIAEDCVQLLFDLGAKDVILYVIAKTRS